MPTYHEVITYEAPVEVVRAWVKAELSPYLWKILKQETDCFFVEEKILGDQPYHSSTFIGPAQVELTIHQASSSTEVVCDGLNEYYGNDVQPKNEHDVLNGHIKAKTDIKIKIAVIKIGLDKRFKDWSAHQNYQRINAEKRLPQPVNDLQNSVADAITAGKKAAREKKAELEASVNADAPIARAITINPQIAQEKTAEPENVQGIKPTTFKPEQLSIEDFVSQLERLANLQRIGALTNTEFEQAKLRLLKATE